MKNYICTDLHLEDKMTTLSLDIKQGKNTIKETFFDYHMFKKGRFKQSFVNRVLDSLVGKYYPKKKYDYELLANYFRELRMASSKIKSHPEEALERAMKVNDAASYVIGLDDSIMIVHSFVESVKRVMYDFGACEGDKDVDNEPEAEAAEEEIDDNL